MRSTEYDVVAIEEFLVLKIFYHDICLHFILFRKSDQVLNHSSGCCLGGFGNFINPYPVASALLSEQEQVVVRLCNKEVLEKVIRPKE